MASIVSFADLSNEASTIVRWEPLKSIALIGLMTSALILGILSRLGIINFIYKMATGRPINRNILVDLLIELPCFTILGLMILVSLILGESIEQLFGTEGIFVFWIAGLVHNSSMAVGGCGIAAFRFICIHDLGFALNIKRAEALMKKLMKLELLTEAILVSLSVFAGITSNEAMLVNFARGYSAKMANIISPTTENDTLRYLGRLSLTAIMAIGCCMVTMELICYIAIYREVHATNEKMKESISKKSVTFRRRKNIISLSTQVIGFFLEIVVGITGAVIIFFRVTDASVFPILNCTFSALMPILHVLGSTEMRDYYYNFS